MRRLTALRYRQTILGALPATLTLLGLALLVSPPAEGQRLLWRYVIDSWGVSEHGPTVGPDGTIYVDDLFGELHAISPQGERLWVYQLNEPGTQGSGAEGPIAVAEDGTIYAVGTQLGGIARLHAIHPDGTRKWVFTTTDTQGFIAGPGIGPDGNIYAVVNVDPGMDAIGAFSLTPAGDLRWSDRGDPAYSNGSIFGQRMIFDGEGFWVGFNGDNDVPPALRKIAFDGRLLVYIGDGCQSVPEPGPNGGVVVGLGVCGVTAYSVAGELAWMAETPPGTSTMVIPSSGPDEAVYTAYNLDGFWALNADGSTRWLFDDPALGVVEDLGVSPDNRVLVSGGGLIGVPGWIRGYDPADGSLLWQEDLPMEEGNLRSASRPRFPPDGRTAYISVRDGLSETTSYLYAIDVSGPGPVCGDIRRLQARCSNGRLQARVQLFDTSHDGETLSVAFDGVPQELTIAGGRAQGMQRANPGAHEVEIVDPAGCFPARTVICP